MKKACYNCEFGVIVSSTCNKGHDYMFGVHDNNCEDFSEYQVKRYIPESTKDKLEKYGFITGIISASGVSKYK